MVSLWDYDNSLKDFSPTPVPELGTESSGSNATDWILENGDDALIVLQQALCAINPRRPGCPGDPATAPVVVQNGPPNAVLYALAAVVVLLLVVLIFKK